MRSCDKASTSSISSRNEGRRLIWLWTIGPKWIMLYCHQCSAYNIRGGSCLAGQVSFSNSITFQFISFTQTFCIYIRPSRWSTVLLYQLGLSFLSSNGWTSWPKYIQYPKIRNNLSSWSWSIRRKSSRYTQFIWSVFPLMGRIIRVWAVIKSFTGPTLSLGCQQR